ncbi:MAG: peptidoglycan-binding protein [Pseudomonadota bacterium]
MKHLAAFVLGVGLLCSGPAVANDRVALVIGNGDYAHTHDAETAVRDARAVSEAFSEAGWQVIVATDLDRFAMRRVLSRFADAAGEAEAQAIYYSGHAIRSGGTTYLAPVTAQADSLTDVLFDGVPLDLILRIASDAAGQSVVFLDGAQLRGFRPSEFAEPGLDQLEGPEGVLIVSAAEPGKAIRRSRWRDSRFARLVIEQFLEPGASADAVARAVGAPTFVTGSVDEGFVLAPEPEPMVESDALAAEIELAYWRAAERSGDAVDYQAYLTRYPEGTFAEFARQRLGIAKDTDVPEEPRVDPAVAAEQALNLSRIRKRRVQEWLLALGHDPRGIDGLFGPGSRAAITAWQRKAGFEVTGYLTRAQINRLSTEGNAAIAEQERIAAERRRIAEAEDNAFWSATGDKGTADGYRAYLKEYPGGIHAKIARAALAKIAEAEADVKARRERDVFRAARGTDTPEAYRDYLAVYPEGIYRDRALARLDAIEGAERRRAMVLKNRKIEQALKLTKQDRISIEQRLRLLGFETGPQDGKLDKRARSAIKGYQASRGLEDTGFMNRETVVILVRETERTTNGAPALDGAAVIEGLIDALGGAR